MKQKTAKKSAGKTTDETKKTNEKIKNNYTKQKHASKSTPVRRNDVIFFTRILAASRSSSEGSQGPKVKAATIWVVVSRCVVLFQLIWRLFPNLCFIFCFRPVFCQKLVLGTFFRHFVGDFLAGKSTLSKNCL